jgi:hypothetical protein
VEVVELIRRVSKSRGKKKKKNERLVLEQRINIHFCVKPGKNASDPCAMLSDAYGGGGGEAMKK